MALTPTRVLRLSGAYYRKEGVSEKDFHEFMSRDHGVKAAAIHNKYGILRYQLAFNSESTRGLGSSLQLPWKIDDHDVTIEFYFKDIEQMIAISSDQTFKDIHVDVEPFLRMDATTVSITWVEAYLEDGKIVNIVDGKSQHPPFEVSSAIALSDKPADKYY